MVFQDERSKCSNSVPARNPGQFSSTQPHSVSLRRQYPLIISFAWVASLGLVAQSCSHRWKR